MIGWEPEDIQVYGMMRSGHHGWIGWMIPHYSQVGHVTHYNNCRMRRNRVDPDDIRRYGAGRRVATVFSFEDDRGFYFSPEQVNRRVRPGRAVAVLRDPYNLFASRLALREKRPDLRGWDCLDPGEWKAWAAEFAGRTDFFPCLIRVSYNRWFADKAYRVALSGNFGPHTDAGLDRVGRDGGGSSFDAFAFQGRAQEMAVFDRWRAYADHPQYRERILRDPELAGYCRKLFPDQYSQMPPA